LLSIKYHAQKIELKVSFNDTLLKPSKLIHYNNTLNLPGLKNELTNIFSQLHQNSYLVSTTDSILVDSSFYHVYIHLGKTYKWTSLTNKNIDEEILSKIGFRDKLYNNKPFNEKQLKSFFNKIILFYENHGYPFASIKLDSIKINDNNLSAQLYIEKHQLYKVDSVLIKGNAKISNQYIKNYIKIKEGDIYKEETIHKIRYYCF
jgi:outer membrane protein assembly factor BamA